MVTKCYVFVRFKWILIVISLKRMCCKTLICEATRFDPKTTPNDPFHKDLSGDNIIIDKRE